MIWTICIATLASRAAKLAEMLAVLLPQAEATEGVEVVALHNRGERALSAVRQDLLMSAAGKYVSFVDDDDLVSWDFVELVVAAMDEDPDFVAFNVAYYVNGVPDRRPCLISLGYVNHDTEDCFFRDITHVNPARTSIAQTCNFGVAGRSVGEDSEYDTQLRGRLKTQVVIGRTLYHYRHNLYDTVKNGVPPQDPGCRRPVIDSPVFRWHEAST